MPSLGETERLILLRAQLSKFLPDHLRCLVNFNTDKSWDDLLVALDQSYVSRPVYDSQNGDLVLSDGIKQEAVDINVASSKSASNYFNGTCNYCKKKGHKIANCFKRVRLSQNCSNNENSRSGSFGEHNFSDRSRNRSDSTVQRQASRSRQNQGNLSSGAHTVSINAYDEDSDMAESNSIESQVVHFNAISNSVPLLKRSVRVCLSNDASKNMFRLKALFDGGATNSFVRLSCLPKDVVDKIQLFKSSPVAVGNHNFRKQTFSINGATSSVVECCVVVPFRIIFGDWSGLHDFIVTDSIPDKEMIIGRDFLKLYNFIIDHGKDLITLDKPCDKSECFTSEVVSCSVMSSVTIEAHSEQIVKCVADDSFRGKTVLFTPNEVDYPVYCAYSIGECNVNGEFYVRVLNPSSDVVVVKDNTKLGFVSTNFILLSDSQSVEVQTVSVQRDKQFLLSKEQKEQLDKVSYGKHLNEEQKRRLKQLVETKAKAFQLSEQDIGLTHLIEHAIDTGDHKPIKQKPYRMPATVSNEIEKEDREKTAFVANHKLYQFRVMSLGLANAPSTYSRLMDLVLCGLTYQYCLVYLDDTIV